jgi:hypothetical protein
MKIELTDSEWMSLIDGEREDGLQRCCANISALRDCLIGLARDGGRVNPFTIGRLQMTLGWVIDGHEIDNIPALVKVRDQLDLAGHQVHRPDTIPEDL